MKGVFSMAETIQIQVNGAQREVAPERSLLNVLREGLNLTGTRFDCGEASCGACTILEDALQCGYCTSGMILASVALLKKNPRPDEAAIVGALQGNVCRCGTCRRILRAVQRASQEAWFTFHRVWERRVR